ncbi:hypothetical protein F7731_09215 [Cytobacillus depressus]|uniref:Uncharacterized protein n=1 Tax=Cytobacillus depressus TaxID=1602942 RepID=A0A6L3V857_9BACI|nr:hypothetical protein [Cytobacillus depressus]KAB2336545.1 hypothetical protein F7731_09215 [Cytobacillus depressus]
MKKEKELENLIETLIRMLGKSNEKVSDLTNRVNQLEVILRESLMPMYHPIQEADDKVKLHSVGGRFIPH